MGLVTFTGGTGFGTTGASVPALESAQTLAFVARFHHSVLSTNGTSGVLAIGWTTLPNTQVYQKVWITATTDADGCSLRFGVSNPESQIPVTYNLYAIATLTGTASGYLNLYALASDDGTTGNYLLVLMDDAGTPLAYAPQSEGTHSGSPTYEGSRSTTNGLGGLATNVNIGQLWVSRAYAGINVGGGPWDFLAVLNAAQAGAARYTKPAVDAVGLLALWDFDDASKPTGTTADAAANTSTAAVSIGTGAGTALDLTDVSAWAGGGGATVTGVTVDPATASVAEGATTALAATVEGTGSPSQAVTWSSSDAAVATVDAAGTVTGVAAGECVITATSDADPGFSGTCAVTVTAVGAATEQFTAVARKADTSVITGRPRAWGTDDPSVAVVDQTGLVTAVGAGTTTLRCRVPSGRRFVEQTATITVT